MKLKKEVIGSLIFIKPLGVNIMIQEGQEEFYHKLGLKHLFEEVKPAKKNDSNK